MLNKIARACWPAFAAAAVLLAAQRAEAHNFVNTDLTWAVEPAPPGQVRYSVRLIDTESAKKNGDTIQFDELELSPSWRGLPKASAGTPSVYFLQSQALRYEVSCGWRSIRGLPVVATNTAPPSLFYSPEGGLLRADARETLVIDRLCAGLPLDAARGAKSVGDASDFWKDALGATNAITVQRILRGDPAQYPLSWMTAEPPRRFVPVPTNDSSGNVLFLDRANTKRDGDIVSASSLVVLGPQFADRKFDAVVALRSVRYDCAHQTLAVLSQALWNSFGDTIPRSEPAFAKRVASELPVTAADVHAACGVERSASQTFATVEDAWSYARTNWPPRPRPAWLSCIWEHYPDTVRADYLSKWQSSFTGAAVPYAPSLPKPDAASAAACSNAHPFQALVEAYGIERAALGALASAHVDETQLKAAFGKLPWLQQRQYVSAHFVYGASNPQLDAAVLNAVTAGLAIAPSDVAARTAVQRYLEADAKLDGNSS